MPLKLYPPREGKTPYWSVRGRYIGVKVDRSTKTGKRAVAARLMSKWEREIECGAYAVPGEPTFASAAASYMKAGGERKYLRKLLEHFGDRPLNQIDQAAIDEAAVALYPKGSAATRNRQVYTPCSAVLRRGGVSTNLSRPKGSGGNKQTAWLWPEQAEAIFAEAEKLDKEFAALLITLCYTGMRLSEALELTWNNVRLADGYAYIPTSKNDEPRAVFLPPVAVAALANIAREDGGDSQTFRYSKSGHLYSLLRVAAVRAGIDLPERSAFHIFRHTFMTWMRRYGGLDEIGLLNLGTHKDRKSVARYTHVVVSEESKRAALLPTPKARTV
jgi:integrase